MPSMNPQTQLLDAELKQLQPLVGGIITGLVHEAPSAANLHTGSFGFRVRLAGPKRAEVTVWVDADPEGNGPGHLNIETN